MDTLVAQAEIRRAYMRGGPGAIVSGIVWLAAGAVAVQSGIYQGFVTLFFGGMLIFPIGAFIVRQIFGRAPESNDNPGGRIALETVFPMIAGFFAAWLILPFKPEWVFALCALFVGTHYFGFRSAYGDWLYWLLAALMSFIGIGSILWQLPSALQLPFVIAAVEILFGLILTALAIKHPNA